MLKLKTFRVLSAAAAIAAVVVQSGAGHKL